MSRDFKCFIGSHQYVIHASPDIKDVYGNVIGVAVVSRCQHCGKVTTKYIYTVNGRP